MSDIYAGRDMPVQGVRVQLDDEATQKYHGDRFGVLIGYGAGMPLVKLDMSGKVVMVGINRLRHLDGTPW